jgi:hypothetical protein
MPFVFWPAENANLPASEVHLEKFADHTAKVSSDGGNLPPSSLGI